MALEKPGKEPNGCQRTKEEQEAASNMREDGLDNFGDRT